MPPQIRLWKAAPRFSVAAVATQQRPAEDLLLLTLRGVGDQTFLVPPTGTSQLESGLRHFDQITKRHSEECVAWGDS